MRPVKTHGTEIVQRSGQILISSDSVLGPYEMEGHVTAITFAVIDVPKEDEKGNDGHGSKVVVLPFDGAGMDRDLAHADQAP